MIAVVPVIAAAAHVSRIANRHKANQFYARVLAYLGTLPRKEP